MRALLPLVRRQLRLRRGQVATLGLLTLIAALLTNTAMVLAFTYLDSLEARAAADRSPDDTVVVVADDAPDAPGQLREPLTAALQSREQIHELDVIDAQTGLVTFDYDGSELPINITVFDRGEDPQMGSRAVVAEADEAVENPIWAPALLLYSENYAVGDPITLTTPEGSATFHIQGFYEDLFGASTAMGMLYFAVDHPLDEPLVPGLEPALVADMRGEGAVYDASLGAVDEASEQSGVTARVTWGANRNVLTRGSAALGAELFTMVFLVLAAVIVVVALVIMRFVMANLVTRDMTAFGVLRAAGFTTAQVIGHLLIVFGGTALVASAMGVGVSHLMLPWVADALAAQSGIDWQAPFSPPATALTLALLTGAVLVFALLGALRVRQVTTVAALRGGTATHSRRSDHLPLATARGPLNMLLGVKTMLQQPAQSLLLLVTITLLTAAPVIALGMASSLTGDTQAFSRMVVGDVEDVTVGLSAPSDTEEVMRIIRDTPGIEDPYGISWDGQMIDDDPYVVSVTDDYRVWGTDSLTEGRYPLHENEVVVGASAARALDLQVGDVHTVTSTGRSAEYVVTGIMSTGRNLGRTLSFTTDGMHRLDPGHRPAMVAASVAPGHDIDAVVADLTERLGNRVQLVESSTDSVRIMLGGYFAMITLLAGVIVSLTVFAVVLVAALVVTTMIVQSQGVLGVKKALGFTTADLVSQIIWTYLPVVLLAALLGATVGAVSMNPLISVAFGTIGMVKMDLSLSPLAVVGSAVGMVAVVLAVTWLAALRLRRVTPVALMGE